jgi:hypothetical protein
MLAALHQVCMQLQRGDGVQGPHVPAVQGLCALSGSMAVLAWCQFVTPQQAVLHYLWCCEQRVFVRCRQTNQTLLHCMHGHGCFMSSLVP